MADIINISFKATGEKKTIATYVNGVLDEGVTEVTFTYNPQEHDWIDHELVRNGDGTGSIEITAQENLSEENGRSVELTISYQLGENPCGATLQLCQPNKRGDTPVPPTPVESAITVYTSSSGKFSVMCDEISDNKITHGTIDSLEIDKTTIISAKINGSCVNEIYWEAFTGCSNLESVEITEGIEIVGGFGSVSETAACISLTGITIPSSAKKIGTSATGGHAFRNCTSLESCIFKEDSHLEIISHDSFQNCTSLTGITIPNSVTEIGTSAFQTCTSFTECTFEPNSSLTKIGEGAFRWARFTNIEIPSSVTSIGKYCFSDCPNLETVVLPPNITALNEGVFNLCSGITSIDIPDAVTSISNVAFCDCFGLTSITIGTGITSIDWQSFRNTRNLTSITIKAVTPPTLDGTAFSGMANCPIYVPSGSVEAYKTADVWSDYASRIQAIP